MSKLSPSKHQAMLLKFMFRFSFVQLKSCPTFFNLSLHILVEHFFSCLLCMCPKFNVFICSSTSVIMAAGAFTSASRTITRVVAGAFLFVHPAVSPQPRTVQPLIVVMHQIVDHTYSLYRTSRSCICSRVPTIGHLSRPSNCCSEERWLAPAMIIPALVLLAPSP